MTAVAGWRLAVCHFGLKTIGIPALVPTLSTSLTPCLLATSYKSPPAHRQGHRRAPRSQPAVMRSSSTSATSVLAHTSAMTYAKEVVRLLRLYCIRPAVMTYSVECGFLLETLFHCALDEAMGLSPSCHAPKRSVPLNPFRAVRSAQIYEFTLSMMQPLIIVIGAACNLRFIVIRRTQV